MRAVRSATSLVRHAGSAASEAILVAAIVGIIALVLAPVYGPARFMTGSDDAAAAKGGGALSATISFAGYAAQPLAVSSPVSFVVTRSVADGTVYWVYNYCRDSSDKLLSTEAYPVLWGQWDSLVGTTYDFTLTGTHCKALVTIRPWTAKPLGDAVMTYDVQ